MGDVSMSTIERSESIAAPTPAFAGLGVQARKPGANPKDMAAQKRFSELLRQTKVRSSEPKNLMGDDAGKARIEAKAHPRDDRKEAPDASEAQAANAAAVINPDVQPRKQVEGTRDGETSATAGQVGATSSAGAAEAETGLAAALSELLKASEQAGDAREAAPQGSGPGHQRGVPPGGGGGTGQGPEIGSITQAEATDVSVKNGSQSQGPGANLAPVAFEDLETVREARQEQGGGTAGDGKSHADADSADPALATTTLAQGDDAIAAGDTTASSSFGAELAKAEAPAPAPAQAAAPAPQAEATRPLQLDDLADPAPLRSAIVEHVEQSTKGGNPSIRLVLNPEHLGEVQVRVTLVNGAVNAQLRVDNAAVSDAVQHQLESLRAALVDQGIKIDKLEVSVSGGSDQRQQDQEAWSGGSFGQQGDAQAQGRQDGAWSLPLAYRQAFGAGSAEPGDAGETPDTDIPDAAAVPAGGLDVRA